MFRILIVDDEKIIREGIGDSLEEYGGFSVSYAADGQEALEICAEQRFDAMLVDIVMPRMDGLELLRRLTDQDHDAIKIVISAHDDFEYAREAMVNNAVDYFLKPFYPSDVAQLAENLTSAITKHRMNQDKYKSLLKQVEESRDIIRLRLIDDLLNDKIDQEDYSKQQSFLGDDFAEGKYRVMMIRIHFEQMRANIDPNEYQARLLDMVDAVGQVAAGHKDCVFVGSHSQVCTFLFNIARDADPQESVERVFSDIKDALKEQNATVCGGIGRVVDSITEIKNSYREACIALKYNASSFQNNTLDIADIEREGIRISHIYDEEALSADLKLGDRAAIDLFLKKMDSLLAGSDDRISVTGMELTLSHILVTGMTILLEMDEKEYFKLENRYYNILSSLRDPDLIETKIQKIRQILVEITEIIQKSRDNQNSKIIEKAKRYIQSRYQENISLNDIAEEVYLSKNYLGQLFKQKTGMNVIDYIHRTRISKAREMMANTDMKLYEIAEAVGYEDQHYFSSVFKRFVGVTPSEYREIE